MPSRRCLQRARGPKALLALELGPPVGHHGVDSAYGLLGGGRGRHRLQYQSTTSFFKPILKHEHGALPAVAADGRSSLSSGAHRVDWGSRAILPVPKLATSDLHATVTPNQGPARTVKLSPFGGAATPPARLSTSSSAPIVDIASASSAGCSFAHAAILHPDPTGSGSVVLHVGTGTIGNGVCNAGNSCYVIVNNASSTDPAETKELPIPLRLLVPARAQHLQVGLAPRTSPSIRRTQKRLWNGKILGRLSWRCLR